VVFRRSEAACGIEPLRRWRLGDTVGKSASQRELVNLRTCRLVNWAARARFAARGAVEIPKGELMKLKPYVEKVGRNGEIKIPPDYLKSLRLSPGEEVELKLVGRHLLMEPVREAVASKAGRRKSISDQLFLLSHHEKQKIRGGM